MDIVASTQQANLFLAGQGSGKTFTMGCLSSVFISKFPKVKGLIAANTNDQLNRSTMYRIRECWKEFFGLSEWTRSNKKGQYVVGCTPPPHFDTSNHNYEHYHNIISFEWGSVIFIGSLENYKALDGLEVGWCLLDETKDTRKEAITEVIVGRLRQSGIYVYNGKVCDDKKGIPFNPFYVFTSPAKVPWLNEYFGLDKFDGEIQKYIYSPPDYFKKSFENKFVVISSTYLNKKNIPANYIQNQENNLPKHLHGMLIFGDPFSKAGGEFMKYFERKKHVGNIKKSYNNEEVLHLTFDFNSVPYITCDIFQIIEGVNCLKKIYLIEEICLKNPKNSSPALADEIIKKYKNHIGRVHLYGDPAGNHANKNTNTIEKKSDFDILEGKLKQEFRVRKCVAKAAPSVSNSADFLNSILEKNDQNLSLLIDEEAVETIADFTYCKEDENGGMEKKRIRDEQTGVMYEPRGHNLDAIRYFICEAFKNEYKVFISRGKRPEITILKHNEYEF
jgi:hypothetical protein